MNARVLVVDDDPAVLKALTRLLRTRALEARGFGSASAFLAALADGLPACLVLDLQMPEMNGLDLLRHLTRKGVEIPTIIITAHADAAAREHCESAGGIAVLTKPVQDVDLFAAIADAGKKAYGRRHWP